MGRAGRTGLLTTCVFLLACAQAFAATPTAPFKQCPPVGVDASCALLIDINSSGQVGVYGDPTQGPYDSVEDTLIGVQNDSSASIRSLPVSSSTGKALFGFDGDGLCIQSNAPSGCPFGPTGYEGPGVSFTNVSSDTTSGTINFSPAIPPGGKAYFSLEEALATVPPFDINPGPPNTGLQTHKIASSANEPVVAVNPTDPKNVVVAYNHFSPDPSRPGGFLVHCGYEVTKDAGQHWSGPYDLGVPSAKGLTANVGGDPSLAFRADGKLFFACLASGDADTPGSSTKKTPPLELYSAVSGDGGATFGRSVILVHGAHSANLNGPDQEQLAAAPNGNAVYLCYTFIVGGNSAAIRAAALTAGSTPSIIDKTSVTAGTHQQNPQGCTLSVAASGRVWAGWWDSGAGGAADTHGNLAYAAHSDNGAASFTAVTALGPKFGSDDVAPATFVPERHVYVQASPIPGDGRVIAVWENDAKGADTIQQAVYSGSSWGAASSIATAATQPSVTWGADGKVAYGYYANSKLDGSALLYQLAQTAGPATGTLSPLQASVNPSSELMNLGPCCGRFPGRFGDYNGTAEVGGTAYGVWTDNGSDSNNEQSVWLGHN